MPLRKKWSFIVKLKKTLIDEFIYGGHLLSLGALGIVCTGMLIYEGSKLNAWPILALAYLTSQIVYNFDHISDVSGENGDNKERPKYVASTKRHQLIGLGVYALLFLVTSFFTTIYAAFLGAFIVSGGLLYTTKTKYWTKKILGFKNLYIAFFWSLLIFLIPLHYSEKPINEFTLAFAIFVFVRWIINSVYFDIKDIESDKTKKLRTLPVEKGMKTTIYLLHFLNVLSSFVIISAVVLDFVRPETLILNIFTIYSFYYLYKIRNMTSKQLRLISYTMVDGEYLLWPLALVIASSLT